MIHQGEFEGKILEGKIDEQQRGCKRNAENQSGQRKQLFRAWTIGHKGKSLLTSREDSLNSPTMLCRTRNTAERDQSAIVLARSARPFLISFYSAEAWFTPGHSL